MKKSGIFAASVAAAASATAISASSSSSNFACDSNFQLSHEEAKKNHDSTTSQRSVSTDKFAPRFDGLRFIETLITGHR